MAMEVSAGASDTLTFKHYYQTENTWDFGFVQVSTDGGSSWSHCLHRRAHDGRSRRPGGPSIVANMPGFTDRTRPALSYVGSAASPVTSTCDLPVDGTFLLAFRFMSDPLVQFDGWHVRNVTIGGAPVDATPADLSDWDNIAFFNPLDFGWMVQLVGLSGTVNEFGHVITAGNVQVVRPTLGRGESWRRATSARSPAAPGSWPSSRP